MLSQCKLRFHLQRWTQAENWDLNSKTNSSVRRISDIHLDIASISVYRNVSPHVLGYFCYIEIKLKTNVLSISCSVIWDTHETFLSKDDNLSFIIIISPLSLHFPHQQQWAIISNITRYLLLTATNICIMFIKALQVFHSFISYSQ